eukprot:scaffold51249_cov18-Tisochrysis_lutea.AAC.2
MRTRTQSRLNTSPSFKAGGWGAPSLGACRKHLKLLISGKGRPFKFSDVLSSCQCSCPCRPLATHALRQAYSLASIAVRGLACLATISFMLRGASFLHCYCSISCTEGKRAAPRKSGTQNMQGAFLLLMCMHVCTTLEFLMKLDRPSLASIAAGWLEILSDTEHARRSTVASVTFHLIKM